MSTAVLGAVVVVAPIAVVQLVLAGSAVTSVARVLEDRSPAVH